MITTNAMQKNISLKENTVPKKKYFKSEILLRDERCNSLYYEWTNKPSFMDYVIK